MTKSNEEEQLENDVAKEKKKSKTKKEKSDDDTDSSEEEEEERRRRRKRRKRKKKHRRSSSKKKKRRKERSRRYSSSSSSDDSSSSSSTDEEEEKHHKKKKKRRVVNERLLKKLEERGETLEEREQRRSQRRAARITARFGYTAEENPFNDPNLHETFTWKKREEKINSSTTAEASSKQKEKRQISNQDHIFDEIEKVRQRRKDREIQFEEVERLRAEESRMKELENYDEWARKEEEFHLQQQRQRSAIRLVEGREKPIDVMAKNLLMFGLTEEERENRAAVKYQEKYNAMNELENLEVELDKPQDFLKNLKLEELKELAQDVHTFRRLESEATNRPGLYNSGEVSTVVKYWNDVITVVNEEIRLLTQEGGEAMGKSKDIQNLFVGQSDAALQEMRVDIEENKIRKAAHRAAMSGGGEGTDDVQYWTSVLEQLKVHLAKTELTIMHNKMLIRQLERLEQKKEELEANDEYAKEEERDNKTEDDENKGNDDSSRNGDNNNTVSLEEELGFTDEIDMNAISYSWQDKFRPRKPRYFHRVKSGYDWNTYNKTHYDHDNPPPKIVQGYRFNVFYPDLVDKTKTPQYSLEPSDSPEFCIIRFSGGPPYEDIAFKIINREWNRSRKHGFKSTFERGILTLYFNFTTHWYRR